MKRAPGSRTAFTLVEVLIVIAIIGMLAGLSTVAVRRAISAARRAAILVEMDQLNTALNAYKEKTREYPPAFADTSAGGEGDYSVKKRFIQHLLFAFPSYNPEPDSNNTGDLIEQQYSTIRNEILANYRVQNLNGNQVDLDLDRLVLNRDNNSQAEALVFWLGGMPTPIDWSQVDSKGNNQPMNSVRLAGFNADPNNPFRFRESYANTATATQRRDVWTSKRTGKMFNFDISRLVDRDNDGWPEYYPELGLGSSNEFKIPYAYFDYRSYARGGAGANAQSPAEPQNLPGYRPFVLRDAQGTAVDSVVPYARAIPGNTPDFSSGSAIEWMGERSFQILCAGLDGVFTGDQSRAFSLLQTSRANTSTAGGGYMVQGGTLKPALAFAENDNLTSFSTTQVGDLINP